jgi:hypothetical protein
MSVVYAEARVDKQMTKALVAFESAVAALVSHTSVANRVPYLKAINCSRMNLSLSFQDSVYRRSVYRRINYSSLPIYICIICLCCYKCSYWDGSWETEEAGSIDYGDAENE